MEQKMAQGAGLTARQKQFLDLAIKEPYLLNTFYLSGGTALSSWYLHHRESFDLDFFSTKSFDYEILNRWFRDNQQNIGYKYKSIDEDYGFLTVNLRYPDDKFLKIDFNHYSKIRIGDGFRWKGLEIDSIYDITVNKIQTVSTRPRTRDYIDLYFIFKENNWPMEQILADVTKKFPERTDFLKLVKNFLKVSEYTDFPKMLVPFDQKEMEKFYQNLAKGLKKNIFK